MPRYKTIKRQIIKKTMVEVEEKVPLWYFRLLLWIFERSEETLDRIWDDTRRQAWDNGFSLATKEAHSSKEIAMQKKLHELGYELRCNFPMARLNAHLSPPTQAVDPAKYWEVVKRVESSNPTPHITK